MVHSCPNCGSVVAYVSVGGQPHVCRCYDKPAMSKRVDQSPDRLPEKRHLGRFELLEEVGAGAFGTVYMARDEQLDRIVAIKVPHTSRWGSAKHHDRFHREARSAAQLRHAGIVPVFDVEQVDGMPCIVSEFVWGETLESLTERGPLPPVDAARLSADVCDALDYAHCRGVVHRDVKAANILVDADGKPRLTDFGLAKRDLGESTVTIDGQILGTPANMSPEQAEGRVQQIDARSDVYAMGVVLYQSLTGELPFRGSRRMVLHQVVHVEPRTPRALNDEIPADVETICLKAMAKEPQRRYASAQEMATDLKRFIRGMPIAARPVGRVERLWRWSRRNPGLAVLHAALLVLLATIAIGSTATAIMLTRAADQVRQRAEQERNAWQQVAKAESKTRHREYEARTESQIARQYSNLLLGVFEGSDPLGFGGSRQGTNLQLGPETRAIDVLRAGARLMIAADSTPPHARAELMNTTGVVFLSAGFVQDAAPLLETALEIRREIPSLDALDLATSLHNVGCLRFAQGYELEAQLLLDEALRLRKEKLGDRHADVAATQYMRAWLMLDSIGPTNQSKRLFEEACDIWQCELGSRHRYVAFGHVGIGMWHLVQDDREKAMNAFQAAGEIFQSQDGCNLLARSVDAFRDGVVHRRMGQLKVAVQSYRRSIEQAEHVLGKQHPLSSYGRRYLARRQQQFGDLKGAAETIRQGLISDREAIGPHPRTIHAMLTLASYEETLSSFQNEVASLRTDALRTALASANHSSHRKALLRRLGQWFERTGALKEAKILYRETLLDDSPKQPRTLTNDHLLAALSGDEKVEIETLATGSAFDRALPDSPLKANVGAVFSPIVEDMSVR